jgi:tol-pal system protein YbgF
MKVMAKKVIVMALMLSPMMVTTAWADEAVLEQRIERLERIIKGQGLVSLLGRVDQLQNEIQRLNGDNESLRHELEAMQRRQREMYIDLDQRLSSQTSAPLTPNQAITTKPSPLAVPKVAVSPPERPQTIEAEQPEQQVATKQKTSDGEPVSPVAVENGEAAYQAALQTLRSGQYEQAIAALAAFPEQYPNSHYLPNTYYWQGEANYVLRNFDLAIVSFQTVIEKFPISSKVADATLKLGFSQYELGQADIAKATLTKVIEQFPSTSAARLAKVRLDRIKQETR